jgi:peptidoglycan/LPS O-acetylase OafA/YrhL
MLIGVAFNFHMRRLLSTAGLVGLVVALLALFTETWRFGVLRDQFPVVTINYYAAVLLFAVLYAARNRIPANPVLDSMAAISFPFYVVHSLLGYSLLRALTVGAGASYGVAFAITLPVLLAVATAIHVAVERPTIRAGRRLARGWGTVAPAPVTSA